MTAHFVIEASRSEVRAFVPADVMATDRSLARRHVVRARRLSGVATIEIDEDRREVRCRIEVEIPGEALSVDPPRLREELGWETIPAEERAAMKRSLREETSLWLAEHPSLHFRARRCDLGTPGVVVVRGELGIRGVTRQLDVPMNVSVDRGSLEAAGVFEVRPEDFGMRPRAGPRAGIRLGRTVTVAFQVFARRASLPPQI
jgi:hypothetical protein